MSSDEPPPRPARTRRPLPLLLALLALVGIVLAVSGVDTTVSDAAGAAPIVDDAARQDPPQYQHASEVVAMDVASTPGGELGPAGVVEQCGTPSGGARDAEGCGPPSLRGPPGA